MINVVLLYETWQQINETNQKLLDLLRKMDHHALSYNKSEDFIDRIERFNFDLREIADKIISIDAQVEKFNEQFSRDDEKESERRKISERRKMNDRRRTG